MLSLSESIFTRVLNNSDKLRRSLNAFADFKPVRDSETTTELDRLIKLTKLADKQVNTTLQTYTKAIAARHDLFYQTPTSLEKRYIIITGAVRRHCGKDSAELLEIINIITELRQIRRPRRNPAKPDEEHHKEIQPIYDSMANSFGAIIDKIEAFQMPYRTAYAMATIESLRTLHQYMLAAGAAIGAVIHDHQIALDLRDAKFTHLKSVSIAVKEAARRQYIMDEERYKLIRIIKFDY